MNTDGTPPTLDEAALLHRINKTTEGKEPEERAALERSIREAAAKVLDIYTSLWKAWAEGERPRRKTIALYGDLCALKHQLEAEETAKPQEFVWGVGIASWQISLVGSSVVFEYPLLTQAIEIGLDEKTMAIELRPRATDTRVEFDAFIACQVTGAADVERTDVPGSQIVPETCRRQIF